MEKQLESKGKGGVYVIWEVSLAKFGSNLNWALLPDSVQVPFTVVLFIYFSQFTRYTPSPFCVCVYYLITSPFYDFNFSLQIIFALSNHLCSFINVISPLFLNTLSFTNEFPFLFKFLWSWNSAVLPKTLIPPQILFWKHGSFFVSIPLFIEPPLIFQKHFFLIWNLFF